jgi:hypothetical protein
MKMFLVFIILSFLLISSNKAHTPGTVTVDTFTFGKILHAFDIVLVKFDEKHRMYSKKKQKIFYSINFF